MTRAWLIASALIVTVVAGLGPGIPAVSASPASAASPASKPSPRVSRPAVRLVLINCAGRPTNRPRTFGLSCGNGADSLRALRWTAWGPGRAVARGTQRIDSCLPDCARGRTVRYPVTVILSGSERVARHPRERRYQTITLRYTAQHPAGVARQVTGNLWP